MEIGNPETGKTVARISAGVMRRDGTLNFCIYPFGSRIPQAFIELRYRPIENSIELRAFDANHKIGSLNLWQGILGEKE